MKKTILSLMIALGIAGVSNWAEATPVLPTCVRPSPIEGLFKVTNDYGRSIESFIAGLIALTGDGESKAQLIATQEGNNINACGGTALCEEAKKENELKKKLGAAGDNDFEGSAFAYVLENVLKQNALVGYAPLQRALSSSKNEKSVRTSVETAVKNTFFVRGESPTSAELQEARSHRQEYIKEASNRHISLAYEIKNRMDNDLSAILEAGIIGDGELGALAIDSYTLEQAIYMELVDLVVQIEMMEADAIQFMVHQPLVLMTKTKPSTGTEN